MQKLVLIIRTKKLNQRQFSILEENLFSFYRFEAKLISNYTLSGKRITSKYYYKTSEHLRNQIKRIQTSFRQRQCSNFRNDQRKATEIFHCIYLRESIYPNKRKFTINKIQTFLPTLIHILDPNSPKFSANYIIKIRPYHTLPHFIKYGYKYSLLAMGKKLIIHKYQPQTLTLHPYIMGKTSNASFSSFS